MYRKFILAFISAFICFFSICTNAEENTCDKFFEEYEKTFNIPYKLLNAISLTESGKWNGRIKKNTTWPWTINFKGKSHHFASKEEAIDYAKALMRKGYSSIDIGCMQVNLRYHPEAFRDIRQAFDPKYNIAYAASLLRKNYKSTNNWQKSIQRYHSYREKRGVAYYNRVMKSWKSIINENKEDIYKISLSEKLSEETPISNLTKIVLQKFTY